ncbi:MAG TPA: sigma-70 family RNA polymerase sigma factor [Gemmataceae bacterium]|nr:sigma-70 family RNA polymerase sigma factor [Gemmataceae bacterium]
MWPNSSETQLLLTKVQNGEANAVDQLLAHHREPMRRMIDMRVDPAIAPRVDASDIIQEVLLEASCRLQDYLKDPAMPFHLWLRHIAQDHIIDAHRRHRQAQRRSVDREQSLKAAWSDRSSVELIGNLIDRELTPATAAMKQEMEKRFQAVLADLEDDDREIILMRHFEKLSNQEVATALGLTEAAASMRYLRAVRRLRALFTPG